MYIVWPGGWCRTSGAGPAARPTPASACTMTYVTSALTVLVSEIAVSERPLARQVIAACVSPAGSAGARLSVL